MIDKERLTRQGPIIGIIAQNMALMTRELKEKGIQGDKLRDMQIYCLANTFSKVSDDDTSSYSEEGKQQTQDVFDILSALLSNAYTQDGVYWES